MKYLLHNSSDLMFILPFVRSPTFYGHFLLKKLLALQNSYYCIGKLITKTKNHAVNDTCIVELASNDHPSSTSDPVGYFIVTCFRCDIMFQCWHGECESRPSFAQLVPWVHYIARQLETDINGEYIDPFPYK